MRPVYLRRGRGRTPHGIGGASHDAERQSSQGCSPIQKAQAAIHAYVRMLEDFIDAAAQLQRLSEKLVGNRARGTVLRGKTRQTLTAKKQLIKRIRKLELGLSKSCPGYMGGAQEAAARQRVQTELNELSAKVLRLIQCSPREAPLTKVSAHFQPGNVVGCAGTDTTTAHRAERRCDVGRNHLKRQGPGQRSEKITYADAGRYQLKVGR